MSLSLNSESFKDNYKELIAMSQDNFEEVELNKDVLPLDVDYDSYILIEELGGLKLFVLRDGDDPVGYWIFLTSPCLHYKGKWSANCDVVYIKPGYRNKNTISCFKAIDETLKNSGVSMVLYHCKANKTFRRLMRIAGYENTEQTFMKVFQEN